MEVQTSFGTARESEIGFGVRGSAGTEDSNGARIVILRVGGDRTGNRGVFGGLVRLDPLPCELFERVANLAASQNKTRA